MRGSTVLLGLLTISAVSLSAQSYYANIDGANCSTLWGYAWDSTQPNTPISIDLYDGGTPVATVLANQAYAGVGNGYHGFSFTIPPSLKDGTTHTIVHYVTGTHINISGSSGIFNCPAGTTGYVYYFSDSLSSINTSNWYQNGSVSGTGSGMTATSTNGGSLISKVSVPGSYPADYEVKTTLGLTASGGTYVSYLRASTNAQTGPSLAGTFYSVEISPTFSGSSCWATMAVNKTISGSMTTLYTNSFSCHNGSIVRSVIRASTIVVWVDGTSYAAITDSSITSGSPGIGALSTPSGNSITTVSLGPGDETAPTAPSSLTFATSLSSTRMDFRAAGTPDDPNGTGVALYQLYRDGSFFATSNLPEFTDETLTASSTHTYALYAFDYAWNSSSTSFSITTPPTGSVDPRRVGLRTTGAYWGGNSEQIDLKSGNLNFTLPLLSPQIRGGGTVPVSLAYNAQNWRQDSSTTWNLGSDVGYGYGWRLSAGSLTPFITYPWVIDHYTFTDATGAEYRLDQNTSGVWSSEDSLYVVYDSNYGYLRFNDGTFWIMGCTSAGTEPDAGTMYPTTIENSNGNQILLHYNAGQQLTFLNSSARLSYIDDVRAQSLGGIRQTYVFVYNVDTVPHLTSVQNTISTAEAYQFTFGSSATLVDPFTGTAYSYSGALVPLNTVTAEGIGMQHAFSYNSSGEMTQVTFPYGGYFKYTYGNVTYSSGFSQPEVATRIMSKDGTVGSEDTYALTHETSPSSYPSHQFTQIAVTSTSGIGKKKWTFSTSGSTIGLATQYQGLDSTGSTVLVQNDFTWAQDSASNFYIGSTLNTYPGPAYTKTDQTVDVYGNVTQVKKYQFGSLTTPARTYNYAYLNSSNYTNRNIYNRLTTATVTDGTTTVYLASNTYDSNPNYVPPFSTNPMEWDSSYSSATYRGNLTGSTTPSGSTSASYDQAGNVAYSTANGVTSTVATSTTTNFAAPEQLTVSSLTTSLSYNTFLGLTNESGPNGDSASASYDTYARPTQTTSPFGATTYYVYNSPPFSSSSPATVTIYPNGTSGRWTKNTLDGFGRTIKTEAGDSSSTKSASEMSYAPCACTPLGKLSTQTMPHAPGASSVTTTTYTYDGIGRTLTSATVGSDTQGTTSYGYTYVSYGEYIQKTDPAGNWKYFVMDAFNDLYSVSEPATASEPSGAVTYYSYDLLDHLTNVSMARSAGTQTRSFTYSGNFLMSATNPENGTVSYTYNSYNKVATKADAKAQQEAYTYDSLGRLTKIQRYPPQPRVVIRANGLPYGGVYPTMTLTLGGTVLGSWTIASTSYGYYTAPARVDFSSAPLHINFTNPEGTGTRQLGVLLVTIDSSSTLYPTDSGVYNSCAGAYGNGSDLVCYGYWEFPTQSFGTPPALVEDTCQQENYTYDTDSTGYSQYPSGRLTSAQYYGAGCETGTPAVSTTFTERYSYSQPGAKVGKRLQVTRSSGTINLDGVYTYDNEGRSTGIQYPLSGPDLGWAYDTMGRPNTMTDLGSSSTIISGATYGPSNELLSISGSVSESRTYNSTVQLTHLTNGSVNINYGYPSTNNNGKIASQTDNISGEQVNYTYDAVNRLASAAATSSSWGQSYSYDGFGNLTDQTVTAGSAPAYHVTYDPTTNRIAGEWADANGNLGVNSIYCGSYIFDVANRLATALCNSTTGFGYSYAPGNKRMWRGVWSPDPISGIPTMTTDEVTYWSVSGQKLATYQLSSSGSLTATQTATWYYFGRKLIKNAGGYVGADRLGSIGKYYPYGQEKPSATTNGTEKFTGYMRDSETGLDYAINRYHNAGTGRFLTVDPMASSAQPSSPGSWNRYAYVLGDPINGTDPTGGRTCSFETMTCDDGSSPFDDDNDQDTTCEVCGSSDDTEDGSGSTFNVVSPQVTGMTYTCADGSETCAPEDMVLTAIGPGTGPGVVTVSDTSVLAAVWAGLQDLFGYNSSIPLPSCFGGFASNVYNTLSPSSPSIQTTVGQSLGTYLSAAKFNQALVHAATRGLTYPNKSSIFRGLMKGSKSSGTVGALAGLDLTLLTSLISEIQDSSNGKCQ